MRIIMTTAKMFAVVVAVLLVFGVSAAEAPAATGIAGFGAFALADLTLVPVQPPTPRSM